MIFTLSQGFFLFLFLVFSFFFSSSLTLLCLFLWSELLKNGWSCWVFGTLDEKTLKYQNNTNSNQTIFFLAGTEKAMVSLD